MQELSFLYTITDIDAAASQVIAHAGDHKVWLFIGEMGAGKTTLIKAISHALGGEGDFSSPTYALVNEYPIADAKGKIFHMDLYRLRSVGEALDIGIEDYLLGGDYCLIEWPQLIMPLLREGEYITIHISPVSDIQRKITIFRNET
jgi:tRNA threonylcarbamoyladenosine biosynthesis protein TsaE